MSRVLVVHNGAAMGGAELSLCEFLGFVQRTRAHTPIVACRPGAEFGRRVSELQIAIEAAHLFRIVRARSMGAACGLISALVRANSSVLQLIRKRRIDLVHANNTASFLQSVFAAKITGVPLIWHVRDQARIPAALRFLEQWANGIIAISRAVACDALWKPERADIIHNGLSLASETALSCEYSPAERRFDVLMAAQFVPWKRHSVFLEAVAELLRRGRRVSAAIVGVAHDSGQRDYARSLTELAQHLGLGGHLQFLPSEEQPGRLLKRARVLVHPAVGEPMGRVVGEAMCLGIPVVASRSGGIPELIENGKTGLLVTPDDASAFADAIEQALNPAAGAWLAENAKRSASLLFDLDKQCHKVLGVYHRALEPPIGRSIHACNVNG